MSTNAIYKRYNGSSWEEIHFKTNASQVIQTEAKVFLHPTTNTINGKTFGTLSNGTWTPSSIVLTGEDIKVDSSENAWTIKTAYTNLTKAISNITSSYVASVDGKTGQVVLSDVYQAKHANLTSLSGLVGNATTSFVKFSTNGFELDTANYATTSSVDISIKNYLTNYYTKEQVAKLHADMKKASMQVVASLPTTGEEGIIYLVGSAAPYRMWVYENNEWIDMGSTNIELTGYVKGSSLTSDTIITGNGDSKIKSSSKYFADEIQDVSTSHPASAQHAHIPTEYAVYNFVNSSLSNFVGTNKITTLGTIATGVWQGTAIASSYIGNLPSSKITSLSGYSIASTYATITTSDSLNTALGKLQKGISELKSAARTANKTYYGTNAPTDMITNDTWIIPS